MFLWCWSLIVGCLLVHVWNVWFYSSFIFSHIVGYFLQPTTVCLAVMSIYVILFYQFTKNYGCQWFCFRCRACPAAMLFFEVKSMFLLAKSLSKQRNMMEYHGMLQNLSKKYVESLNHFWLSPDLSGRRGKLLPLLKFEAAVSLFGAFWIFSLLEAHHMG